VEKIRVLFDEQIFLIQKYGGISRYFSELIGTFREHPEFGIEPIISSHCVINEHLINRIRPQRLHRVSTRLLAVLLLVRGAIRGQKIGKSVDLIHATYYLPGFFRKNRRAPLVTTLFDMIPEVASGQTSAWNPHFAKKTYLLGADLVLSISASSTSDMIDCYGLDIPAITTYLGVGPEFSPIQGEPSVDSERYFLFVGNRQGYKDCQTAINAFSKISHHYPGVRLNLIGGGGLTSKEKKLIAKLGLGSRVTYGPADALELPSLYRNSLALLYPTRHEGFGLPLVEAMASGTPVVASKTAINIEVCAQSATYFDVGDESELSLILRRILDEPAAFTDKIHTGVLRAKDFSWLRCAQQTAEAYKAILKIRRETNGQ
jgi:glycosyltransferase involved in cell wall biosynthesis